MTKVCCVCKKDGASYKCPVCKEPYCSVDCCKLHKTVSCEPPMPLQEETLNESSNVITHKYEFPTEDTVPVEKLQQLCHNDELRNCLKNPHVRHIMKAILADPNPTKAIALAMTEPIFVEMADACLKSVEPSDESKPC